MSKKSRRKAKYRANAAKTIQAEHPQQPKPAAVKPQPQVKIPHEAQMVRPQPSARASPVVQDSVSRYQYVMPEVKRIGILAGSMILILIILTFVL